MLRSGASWSIGIKAPEISIHAAWIAAIAGAQHYVYVENQFFISGKENGLKNEIADAIVDRIVKAHEDQFGKQQEEAKEGVEVERGRAEKKEEENAKKRRSGGKFRVYVIIPLLPSFRGTVQY